MRLQFLMLRLDFGSARIYSCSLSYVVSIELYVLRIIIIIIYQCETPRPNYRLCECRFFFRPADSQLRPVLAGCRLIWLTTTLSPQSSARLTPP
jgi:hypothetical protein